MSMYSFFGSVLFSCILSMITTYSLPTLTENNDKKSNEWDTSVTLWFCLSLSLNDVYLTCCLLPFTGFCYLRLTEKRLETEWNLASHKIRQSWFSWHVTHVTLPKDCLRKANNNLDSSLNCLCSSLSSFRNIGWCKREDIFPFLSGLSIADPLPKEEIICWRVTQYFFLITNVVVLSKVSVD